MSAYLAKQAASSQIKSFTDIFGDDNEEDDKRSPEEEEADRQAEEQQRTAEEERKAKHRQKEEEREKMRQNIRDKYGLTKNKPAKRGSLKSPGDSHAPQVTQVSSTTTSKSTTKSSVQSSKSQPNKAHSDSEPSYNSKKSSSLFCCFS